MQCWNRHLLGGEKKSPEGLLVHRREGRCFYSLSCVVVVIVVVSLVLVVCGYCSSFALNLDPTAVCKMTGGILQCSEHLG